MAQLEIIMSLTPSQQAECSRLLPIAKELAARYRDDEFLSIAQLTLVEAVCQYAPWCGPIEPFVRRGIRQAISNAARRQGFERHHGLRGRGGEPDEIAALPRSVAGLHEHIATLPAALRSIAERKWIEGKTHREVRAELGISWESYNERLAAARESIREFLE